MLSNLKVYNEFNKNTKIIKGYVSNPDNDFEIDLSNSFFQYKSKKASFTKENYFFKDADYYINTEVLENMLDFKLSVSNSSLYIYLNSKVELPVLADDKRKGNNIGSKYEDGSFAPLLYNRKWYLLGGALMDFNVGTNRSQSMSNYNYSGNIGMQLLGGDLQANSYGYYQHRTNEFNYEYNYRWRLYLGDNGILSQINFGDLTNSAMRINSMPSRRLKGVQISNEVFQSVLFFDNTVIQDYIEPGWTVELYKNGVLVDQKTTDAAGYYRFQIPVMYGSNSLELKFYGTHGEFRVSKELVNIPSEFYKTGEIRYSANVGKEFQDSIYMSDSWLSIGLTNWLSNSFNVVKRFDTANEPQFNDHLSLRLSKSIYGTLDYQYKNLYKATLNTNFSNSSTAIIGYTKYIKENSNAFSDLNSRIDLNYSSSRIFELPISMNLALSRYQYSAGADHNFSAAFFTYYYPFNIQLKYGSSIVERSRNFKFYNQMINNEVSYSWYTKLKWLRLLNSSRLSMSYNYDIDIGKLIDFSMLIDQNIGSLGNFNLKFSHDMMRNTNSFQAGLNLNLSFLRSQTQSSVENRETSYSQNIQGSVGLDHHTGTFYFNNSTGLSTVGNGAANIHFYLDTNANGRFDKGEYEIPGVQVNIPNATSTKAYGKSSTLAYNLQAYGRFNLIVDEHSIKNPNWIPRFSEFSFIADPNVYKEINVPCYMGGIIEGSVYYKESQKKIGQPGVKVHISNKEKGYNTDISVFSDGSFYKMGIPPGKYEIWVDSTQCSILDIKPVIPTSNFTIIQKMEGDYVGGLDLEVERNIAVNTQNPKSEESIVKVFDNVNENSSEASIDLLANIDKNIEPVNINNSNIDSVKSADNTPNMLVNEKNFTFDGHKTFYYKTTRSYKLTRDMTEYLDNLADYLKKKPILKLTITGHSDGMADLTSNMKISENRATIVAKYLISKGISKDRVLPNGKGALVPITSNSTPEGRQKNRRVEIEVIP